MTPVDRSQDCWTCGYPSLRMGGHAEWCERVKARLAAIELAEGLCPRCGRDCKNARGLAVHTPACRADGVAFASTSAALVPADHAAEVNGAAAPISGSVTSTRAATGAARPEQARRASSAVTGPTSAKGA
jgi:hypothetical protein